MAVIGKKISTRKFDWVSELNEFITDASGLRGDDFLGPLYDDACDQGFVLVSHKSNAEIPVYLAKVERHDGDIVGWEFKPVDSRITEWCVFVSND